MKINKKIKKRHPTSYKGSLATGPGSSIRGGESLSGADQFSFKAIKLPI